MFRISSVAFQDGLSHEIFPFIGALASVILALHYYHKLALFFFHNIANVPVQLLDPVGFLAVSVGVGFVFKFIRLIVDKIIKVTWHPVIEKIGGIAIGILRASVVASMVLIMIALLPLPYLQRSIRDRSLVGMQFLGVGPALYGKVSGFLPTITIEGQTTKKEDMVQSLVSDKSIARDTKEATHKKTRLEKVADNLE